MIDRCEYIINIAKDDENVRGVVLYGSRVNPDINPDQYQDYDICYIVNNKDNFDISIFKNVKLRFVPSKIYPELFQGESAYLMLFDDDSRIDLTICTIEFFLANHKNGQLMKCLLDKDNKLHGLNENDNSIYWIKPIDENVFQNTCSEFFWEIQNMAKGLKRDELSFAMFIRDISLRDMLNRIIDIYIGMNNDYKVSVGTLGKYRKKYLSDIQYELYKNTYISNTMEDIWNSLYSMIDLFGSLGKCIANKYNYEYPDENEQYMRDYLHRIIISKLSSFQRLRLI